MFRDTTSPAHASAIPSICLFTDSLAPSGVGTVMLSLIREWRGRYRLGLIAPPTGEGEALLGAAARLGAETLAADALRDVGDWHRARGWLEARNTALLHVHAGIAWEGLTAPNLARMGGVRRVLRHEHQPHRIVLARDRRAYAAAMTEVDRVICVGRGVRDSLTRAGLGGARVAVVQNGIDLPAPAMRRVRGQRVLCVARFAYQKGHLPLLRAWPTVLARVPDARLDLVGTGPLEAGLRALASRLGVAGAVRFLGARDDVPALMAEAALVVVPSRWEGLPLVLLEAMARGVPVIGTAVCGSEELLDAARLVPPDDPAALAHAIATALLDPNREREAAYAAGDVRARFGAARMAAEVAAHVDDLIGDGAAQASNETLSMEMA